MPTFSERLLTWQRQHGRHHLPWSQTRDPYRVWLSEIMLQQTQVSTVLGYYARFLERFPSVQDLADAPDDLVMSLWAGLGYYSRARNLHRCAQAVVAQHGGRFPTTAAELATLPGIGPSTAAAIASFCFGQRVSIMDGNVQRVLTRVLGHGEDMAQAKAVKALWRLADGLVPDASADMPAYTQGLMDLGAGVCTPRKPQCGQCPMQDCCVAHQSGDPLAYPVKTRKLKRGTRESWGVWLEEDGWIWMEPRDKEGIWGGLWTFPLGDSPEAALAWAEAAVAASGAAALDWQVEAQPSQKHVLTHLDWRLHATRWQRTSSARAPSLSSPGSRAMSPQAPCWSPAPMTGTGRWFCLATLASEIGLPRPFQGWLGM